MRGFIPVTPTHHTERQIGEFLFQHERYRGFVADSHQHDALQVTMLLAGRMRLVVDDHDHLIGPGGVIVLPANVSHAVIHLDGDVEFLCVTAPIGWLEHAGAHVAHDSFLWPLAKQLAKEIDAPDENTDRLLLTGLEQLAILLDRAVHTHVPSDQDPRLMRVIDRMVRDHAEELTVAQLVREATMSPRHFERLFKQLLGVTPRRYLIEVRLAVAQNWLATSDFSITRIAREVGFAQTAHFIASFRRRYGVTPAAYRHQRALN